MDKKENLTADLENNVINLRAIMSNSSDLTVRHARAGGVSICLLFCEGMVSSALMGDLIFRPINHIGNEKKLSADELLTMLQDELLLSGEQKQAKTYEELMLAIMSGFVAIFIEGVAFAVTIGIQGYQTRSVEQPSTQANIRGTHEGFVESVRTNVSLIRRRMKTPDMVFKMMRLGSVSNTDVCMCYVKNKADPKLVENIENRLKSFPLSTILEGAYIQPFLEVKGDGIFSEIGTTERPDTFIGKLYGGRVGIFVDGTPFALFVPHLFTENFSVIDDYTGRPSFATLMRLFRFIAYFGSILLPGFYVAIADFNPELFPDTLLLNISASVQDTPYPLLLECLLIHVCFEIMREAGLRMPSNVGHAVSIVGGLVIGQIVVSAGLVGAPLVLIVAVAAITSFVVPELYESIIVMRFLFILTCGMWGLFGLTILAALFFIKLCSQSIYGIPHMAPILPFSFISMRDTLFKLSWRSLVKQEVTLNTLNGVTVEKENSQ